MNITDSQSQITKEIIIEASPETIFAALTEPDQLTQWWGDESMYRVTHMDSDLRVGGTWRSTGTNVNGATFVVEGVYREIDRPRLLEYSWRHTWDGLPEETLVRYELSERDGSTLLRVVHSGFTNVTSRDNHAKGWDRVLGWLKNFTE